MSESQKLFRSVRTISLCTFLSRILGLTRDIICAGIFGTGLVWDAFAVAFKIPNLFRRLFGEGALSAAFIPIFTEQIEKHGKEEAWRFVNIIGTLLIILLGVLVLLGEVSFLSIPRLFQIQQKWLLICKLLVIMFPYVFFICLVAFLGAILNTLRHFFIPALAPVALNICWIGGAMISYFMGGTQEKMINIVAVSIFFSGVVQVLIHVPILKRKEFLYRPAFQFSHPGIKLILKRMGPIIFGLAVVQFNVLIDSFIAIGFATTRDGPSNFSMAGMSIPFPMKAGAASVLYYSDRLIQFPLGVFGIAMATAVFPLFSAHAVREDWSNFSVTFNKAIKFMLFIGIPASLAIIILREPIVDLIYRRNEFGEESAYRTSRAILFYATGIWAYCGLHVLIRAFYSLRDSITPLKIGATCVGLNLVLNMSLIWILQESGLALSTSISAITQIIVLMVILQRRFQMKIRNETIVSIVKTTVASIVMAFTCFLTLKMFPISDDIPTILYRVLRLFIPMLLALAAFVGTSLLLKSDEFKNLMKLSLKK